MDGTLSFVIFIVIAIILCVIGFFLAYKLYLWRFMPQSFNDFFDKHLGMIPLIGPWTVAGLGRTSGYNIASRSNPASSIQRNAVAPETGVREGVKNFGHGNVCMWNPAACNVFDNTPLGLISGRGRTTEQQDRINAETEMASQKFIESQYPNAKRILDATYNGGNTALDIQNHVENVKRGIESTFNAGQDPSSHIKLKFGLPNISSLRH